MASRFEIYKDSIRNTRDLETDIQELETLYNSKKVFNQNYDFDEFVKLSIEGAETKFDHTIKEFFDPTKPEDKLKDNPQHYKSLFGVTELEKIAKEESRDWKSTRRAVVTPYSEATEALLNLGRGAITKASDVLVPGTGKITAKVLPNETEIRRNTDKFFRGIAGKDIYETKVDAKTGETYYELEDATTTAEAISRPVSELLAGIAITKKPTKAGLEAVKKGLAAPGRKKGRPSKLQKTLESRADTRIGRLEKFEPLIKAEVASQFTFVDDPDFAIVAGGLSNFIGDDDTKLSALFDYLDTDEDSPEAARRLSLLLDGVVFSSAFGAALGTGKLAVKGVTNLVNKIKESGPEGVARFKELINVSRQSDSANKTVKPVKQKPDVPIIRDLNPSFASEDSLANKGWRMLQETTYALTTRGGMYAPGMLDIIKKSEYDKIAWSARAMDIHSKLVTSIKKVSQEGKYTEDQIEDLFQHYLTGQKKNKKLVKLKDLPEQIQPHALAARENIDNLSTMLAESKYIPKKIREQINSNMGKYLRKTYEAFENPSYKPSKELYDNAVSQIKLGLQSSDQAAGRVRPRPTGWYQRQAEKYVDNLLNKNKGKSFNNFESHINSVFGAKNAEKVFKARKNISPAIDELLGGKVATSTSVFRTIETLSSEITQYKLMDDLYKDGLGKWFFKGTGKYSVAPDKRMEASKIVGQGFHKLNGVNTTEGIANLFSKMKDVPDPGKLAMAYGYALKLKGFSQAAATVYNLTTHVRNTVGGGLILMRNGMNPFSSDTTDALKILDNQIRKSPLSKNAALTEIYEEYQRLGLVNQNVKVGEFKKLFNDYVSTKDNSLITNPKVASSKLARLNKNLTNVYVAEDDMWRIAGYNKELQTLQKAYPNKSIDVLKQEAADIIRDTMPTYDLIAPGIQQLRKLPVGNFFSFTAEQYRNNYNTLMRGMKEIRTGNEVMVERGMKRLASQIAVTYGMGKGATDLSKKAWGVTDEDEKAIRHLNLPEWSKNSALIFDRDEDGNIEYIDLTYTDPSAPITDVFRAFLNEATDPTIPSKFVGDKVLNGMKESMMLFLKPFTGPAILTDKVLDVTFNQGKDYETGRLIPDYNPGEGSLSYNNLMASFNHLATGVIPREIQDDLSLLGGKKAERIKKGELSLGTELFSRLTGQRTITVKPSSIKRSLSFKMYDLSNKNKEQKDYITSNIRQGRTPQQILNTYKKANSSYYKSFTDAKLALEAARHFNTDIKTISNTAQSALRYFTSSERNNFLASNNSFVPLRLTEYQLKSIKRKVDFNKGMTFSNFYDEYNNLLLDYHYLPIIEDIDNKYRTYTPMELMRTRKSVGGIVEGEDNVPFTKEDPADRVDPFTGEPYQEQMSRLGFSNGMGEPENLIAKSIAQLANEKRYNFDYEENFDKKTGKRIENIYVNKGDTRGKFVRDVYLNAKARGLAYPEIVASQAAAESRYGASKIAQEANNLFGIKLRKGETGEAREFMTKEDYGQGQVPEKANFRVFNSVDESVQGYNTFIKDKKYNEALQAKTPMEYLQKIKDAGYATDQSYVKTVGDVYQQYKDAGIFD